MKILPPAADAHACYISFVHAVVPGYWRNEIVVGSETVCFWLVDHSYDRTIKTLCYL